MRQVGNFQGLRVASLESRRSEDMAKLIQGLGGSPFVSPSMRETPIDNPTDAIHFANGLITGQIDLVILMTGVGFRFLLAAVEKRVDRQRFLDALSDVPTIARGPKPVAAMKDVGLTPTHRIPEPNTWREVLTYIDAKIPISNMTIGLQEYGKPNPSLIAGLEARGARVYPVQVYQWDFPLDSKPLEENIRAIVRGERDVLLFTSAHQVTNLFRMAEQLEVEDSMRERLKQMVVASVGPTTSEAIREKHLEVDVEPEHPKMTPLVEACAENAARILKRKQRDWEHRALASRESIALQDGSVAGAAKPSDPLAPWRETIFIKACLGEPTPVTPIWMMRQAGRYMEEYRRVRGKTTFLELCKNPELCSEVMCVAVEKLGVDAAILFSDLLPILEPMGMDLDFAQGEGPTIYNPLREAKDIDRFRELEQVDSLGYVFEAVRRTRRDLPSQIPLIGFAGAPFTLASYAIEGGGSRNYLLTKGMMYRDRSAWDAIMSRLARSVTRYLNAQIAAGAQCVQLFDSWAGCLSPSDYREYVFPYSKMVFDGITPGVPTIHFATGNPALLPIIAEAGSRVVGLDWRIEFRAGWDVIGKEFSVQGNLDPAILLADRKTIESHAKRILDQAAGQPGHIFNLGHGVHQQTPVENARFLVDVVHEWSAR